MTTPTRFMTQLACLLARIMALVVLSARADPSAQLYNAQSQPTVTPAVASFCDATINLSSTRLQAMVETADQHCHAFGLLLHCHSFYSEEAFGC